MNHFLFYTRSIFSQHQTLVCTKIDEGQCDEERKESDIEIFTRL